MSHNYKQTKAANKIKQTKNWSCLKAKHYLKRHEKEYPKAMEAMVKMPESTMLNKGSFPLPLSFARL